MTLAFEDFKPGHFGVFGPVHVSREDIIEYQVVAGDTIFGIAEKFGLQPEWVLWSNKHILGDNPAFIRPGLTLLIPPFQGVVHQWVAGVDGLNGVAKGTIADFVSAWPLGMNSAVFAPRVPQVTDGYAQETALAVISGAKLLPNGKHSLQVF